MLGYESTPAIAGAISITVLAVVTEPMSALVRNVAAPAWALWRVFDHAARAICRD